MTARETALDNVSISSPQLLFKKKQEKSAIPFSG
jgi:hypothetical protein